MYAISAKQIRAARAMLDWSQETLATESGVCTVTIRNLEKGILSPRKSNLLRKAYEKAGLEFLENDGVAQSKKVLAVLDGENACELFLDDLFETLRKNNGQVTIISKSFEHLAKAIGADVPAHYKNLENILHASRVKCLLSETPQSQEFILPFEFKVLPNNYTGSSTYFTYGNKYVIALKEDNFICKYVIFTGINQVQYSLEEFDLLWARAVPLNVGSIDLKHPHIQVTGSMSIEHKRI